MDSLFILDLIGTFTFSIVGAISGLQKGVDLLGAWLLALITGLGGGILCDVMLNEPAAAFQSHWHLSIVTIAAGTAFIFPERVLINYRLILVLDAIGLGVFAVMGAQKAIQHHLFPFSIVIIAVINSVGGGMIRDALLKEIPGVLRREVYATSALIGAFIFYSSSQWFSLETRAIMGITSTFVVRMFSLNQSLHLPFKSLKKI